MNTLIFIHSFIEFYEGQINIIFIFEDWEEHFSTFIVDVFYVIRSVCFFFEFNIHFRHPVENSKNIDFHNISCGLLFLYNISWIYHLFLKDLFLFSILPNYIYYIKKLFYRREMVKLIIFSFFDLHF